YAVAPQSAPPAPSTVAYQPGASTAPQFSTLESASSVKQNIPNQFVVKTTAYTHTEADSLQYGTKSAIGDDLKYGRVRSAAADWSRYPVGTRFKIKGLPYEYVVDDYGRALVGTDTIDLYKPNASTMDQWGARNVGIEVLEWGSFEESKRILEGRKTKPDADHVRKMLNNIEQKIRLLPPALRNGFRA
ncbi:MAG: 3D domain-containing protein, partial [Verrucomicrobiae bacterium]|nr:3D domain-containing protein [Verrucomicrobiae bacterium]